MRDDGVTHTLLGQRIVSLSAITKKEALEMAIADKVSSDSGTQAMFENMPEEHQMIVLATVKILDERFETLNSKLDRLLGKRI